MTKTAVAAPAVDKAGPRPYFFVRALPQALPLGQEAKKVTLKSPLKFNHMAFASDNMRVHVMSAVLVMSAHAQQNIEIWDDVSLVSSCVTSMCICTA